MLTGIESRAGDIWVLLLFDYFVRNCLPRLSIESCVSYQRDKVGVVRVQNTNRQLLKTAILVDVWRILTISEQFGNMSMERILSAVVDTQQGGESLFGSIKIAVLPIAKVFTVCFLGFLMASKYVNILPANGRKLLNGVRSFLHYLAHLLTYAI